MRVPGRSLRARVVWTTAAVSAVAMAAMVGTVVLILHALARNSIDTALDDRLSLVSSVIDIGDNGVVEGLEIPDDSIDDSTWVFDASGRLLDGPRAGKRVQATVDTLGSVTVRTTLERRDRAYVAAPVAVGGADSVNAVVVVSQSLEPYEATRTAVTVGLCVLGLVVTAGSTAVAAWTVRRALAPVETMAAQAEDWSEHDLESRFDDPVGHDEIALLSHTLNVLLDRVAGALRREQQLTSELAHEMRTPLTAIRGEAELALLTRGGGMPAKRLERVVALVEKMDTTITTLLTVARGHAERGATASAADIIASVLEHHPSTTHLSWVAEMEDAPDAPATVAVPLEVASRALAPLVDNAARHAHSVVTLSSVTHDRTVDINVSDDGLGIAEDDVDLLFRAEGGAIDRGTRLGLALARRVARTLGGEVAVSSAHDPTCFTLTLPRY